MQTVSHVLKTQTMSVIYEVNVAVSTSIQKEYSTWLQGHIPQILQFKGFRSAKWFQEERVKTDSKDKIFWIIQYEVSDRRDLEEYFTQHAPRMREEALQKFGNAFEVHRRIFELVETY